METHCNYNNIS